MKIFSKRTAAFFAAAVLLGLSGCGRGADTVLINEKEGAGDGAEAEIPPGTVFAVLRAGRDYERGESLSRAEYLRDLELREQYGVSAETEIAGGDGATADRFLASAAAGEEKYGLVIGAVGGTGYPLLRSGATAGEDDCPALEFSRFPESLSLAGRSLAAGAIAPGSYGDVSCVLMNLDAARAFNVTAPSPGVAWTFDDMISAASAIPTGTGLYRYAASDGGIGLAFVRAAGARLTEQAEGRLLVAGEPSEAVKTAVRKASGILSDESRTKTGSAAPTFAEGRALFLFCRTSDAMALRATGADFLILPYPSVFDSVAPAYADSVSGEAAAIPAAGLGAVRGRVLREYDRLSGKYVDTERYDALLSGVSAYDSESRTSVDALLQGVEYELCEACGAGGFAEILGSAVFDPSGEIPPEYAHRAAAISAELRGRP